MSDTCLICKREAKNYLHPKFNDTDTFVCPNCGEFSIVRRAQSALLNEGKEKLFKLSALLSEIRVRDGKHILLSNIDDGSRDDMIIRNYESFIKEFPSSALEILERSLLNLSFILKHPADKFFVVEDVKELFFSKDEDQLGYVINQLSNFGFITEIDVLNDWINVETQGWEKIEELRRRPAGIRNQAFIAMWFDKTTEEIFTQGIQPAVESDNIIKAVRVDFVEHNNKICDQIIAEIKKSKYLVADFSGNRGGVYFEAGFAQGLGIPVIWVVQEQWVKELHFDTRQYNHIVYSDYTDLFKKLKARIDATIN